MSSFISDVIESRGNGRLTIATAKQALQAIGRTPNFQNETQGQPSAQALPTKRKKAGVPKNDSRKRQASLSSTMPLMWTKHFGGKHAGTTVLSAPLPPSSPPLIAFANLEYYSHHKLPLQTPNPPKPHISQPTLAPTSNVAYASSLEPQIPTSKTPEYPPFLPPNPTHLPKNAPPHLPPTLTTSPTPNPRPTPTFLPTP